MQQVWTTPNYKVLNSNFSDKHFNFCHFNSEIVSSCWSAAKQFQENYINDSDESLIKYRGWLSSEMFNLLTMTTVLPPVSFATLSAILVFGDPIRPALCSFPISSLIQCLTARWVLLAFFPLFRIIVKNALWA